MKAPCLNCPYRRVGCHSICPAYKVFQAEQDAINRARIQQRISDSYTIDTIQANKGTKFRGYLKRGRKEY